MSTIQSDLPLQVPTELITAPEMRITTFPKALLNTETQVEMVTKSCSLFYCSLLDLVDICFLLSSNLTGVMKTWQVTKGPPLARTPFLTVSNMTSTT